jgi:hypothetical protein
MDRSEVSVGANDNLRWSHYHHLHNMIEGRRVRPSPAKFSYAGVSDNPPQE